MRTSDLLRSAAGGLWRQKVRTALTLAGVAVGSCSLAFSLSLGVGLRAMIDREFQTRPGFWEVEVQPGGRRPAAPPPGAVTIPPGLSPERAARLKEHLVERYRQTHAAPAPVPLTPAALAEIAAHPDVAGVVVARALPGRATLGDRDADAMLLAVPPDADGLAGRVVAGRLPAADTEAAVTESLLYDLGVRDEAGFTAVVGSSLKMEVGGRFDRRRSLAATLAGGFGGEEGFAPGQLAAAGKLFQELPRLIDGSDLPAADKAGLKALLAGEGRGKPPKSATAAFTVVGVLRDGTADDHPDGRSSWVYRRAGAFAPAGAAGPLVKAIAEFPDDRLDGATVKVRPGADLPAVVKQIEDRGYTCYSSVRWFTAAKREVTAIAAGLNVFALIALFVAALGITNTLVTTVVERTKEIGILKALGARDGAVLFLFLAEGLLIGLVGGLLGLGLARIAAGPADGLVKRLVQEQSNGAKLLTESVFEFPPGLCALTVAFAAGVTTLAALYPARRAARVRPVEALRHE